MTSKSWHSFARLLLIFSLITIVTQATALEGSSSSTLQFKQGAEIAALNIDSYDGVQDTTLISGSGEHRNYGSANSLWIGLDQSNQYRVSLLHFDLTALQGQFEEIKSVRLTLTILEQNGASGTITTTLHSIAPENAGWNAGSANGAASDGAATWAHHTRSSRAWKGTPGLATAGTDYLVALDGSRVITAPGSPGMKITWDLPIELIQQWINGENAGLLLRADVTDALESSQYFRFASSEAIDVASLPLLEITYRPIPESRAVTMICAGVLLAAFPVLNRRIRARIRKTAWSQIVLRSIVRLALLLLQLPSLYAEQPKEHHLITQPVQLSPNERLSLSIPSTKVATRDRIYIQIRARLNSSRIRSGSAPAFRLEVNGIPLQSPDRLINKPNSFISGLNHIQWYAENGLFTAMYDAFETKSREEHGRLHDYVFDITDLVLPSTSVVVSVENAFDAVPATTLEIERLSCSTARSLQQTEHPKDPLPYYLSEGFTWARKKAISRHKGSQHCLGAEEATSELISFVAPAPLPPIDITWRLSPAMGLAVTLKGTPEIPITTMIGTPDGGWLNEDALRPLYSKNEFTNGWRTQDWKLERTVQRDSHGLIIQDYVTNLTNQDLPLAMLHKVHVGELRALEEFRLHGRSEKTFSANTIPSRATASYPVAYLRDKKRAYAFVFEDDALRGQSSVMTWDEWLTFGTDQFYLPPKASYTFRFRLIGAPSRRYSEILNRLRAAWNNYQEIPGLFGFIYSNPGSQDAELLSSPEKMKTFFDETGITIPCVIPATPNKLVGDGKHYMIYGHEEAEEVEDGIRRITKPFVDTMRQAKLDLPLLYYYNPHLLRTDGNNRTLESMNDAVVADFHGNPLWYRPKVLRVVLPTLETSPYQRFRENMALFFAPERYRGVFLDEWDHSYARYLFDQTDGMSARLDASLRLVQKLALVPVIVQRFHEQVITDLKEKDAVIFANQMDQTARAQSLPVVHFAEPSQYDHYILRAAQVSRTPLSLNLKRSQSVWDDFYEYLKSGILLCFYAKRLTGDHALKYVYPITVRSMEFGVVASEEKIITLRSGSYSFSDGAPFIARIFNALEGHFVKQMKSSKVDGQHRVILNLDSQVKEIAVLCKGED